MRPKKLISIELRESKLNDLKKIQIDLQKALRPFIFEISSMQELLYESLKLLKPVHKSVKNNEESIEKNILKVLGILGLLGKGVKLQKFSENGKVTIIEGNNHKPVDTFKKWVLGYDKVPIQELNLLKPNVEAHLRQINELVKEYEQNEEVIKLLNGKTPKRDHQTKTILDFYNRSVKERQVVLEYYLNGVYDRAIEKSKYQFLRIGGLDWFNRLKDYPYELGKGWWGVTLDYRKIDCCTHRISEFEISGILKFQQLYEKNKERFYRLLFRERSINQIFQNIDFNLAYIPLSKDRTAIFLELKRLFKGRKWLSFYALALPQVEGLFAEMMAVSYPNKKTFNSLPDKVKSVRPDYSLSDSFFDYYEYVLPEQRNSFSHTGYGEGFKLKAYDLLTDLEHVLTVFVELERPLVKVFKIMKRRDHLSFISPEDFVGYFMLLDALDQKQVKEKKDEIDEFNNEFLKKDCSLEFTIQEAAQELVLLCFDLKTKIEQHFKGQDSFINFECITKPKINELKKDERISDRIREFFTYYGESSKRLFILRDFFVGIRKHLYNVGSDDNLKEAFDIWESKRAFIKKMQVIEEVAH